VFDLTGNKRKKLKLYERIADYCEVSQDYVAPVPVFTFLGNRKIEIDGCRGILEYSADRITLIAGNEKFTVFGEGLTLSDFRFKVLCVRGNIRGVVFGEIPRKEGDDV